MRIREDLMAILNYTTSISAEKTLSEIQYKLAKAGVQAVMSEYGPDGVMSAISFRMDTTHGICHFRLPANIEGVYESLDSTKLPNRLKTRDQAVRVGWRILKDWIEAQLAIVEAGMAEMTEVFLPYAITHDGQTLYRMLSDSGMKQLTGGSNAS